MNVVIACISEKNKDAEIRRKLVASKYEVLVTCTIDDTVQALLKKPAHGLLLDLTVFGEDGLQLLKNLRASPAFSKVQILAWAVAGSKMAITASQYGAKAVIDRAQYGSLKEALLSNCE